MASPSPTDEQDPAADRPAGRSAGRLLTAYQVISLVTGVGLLALTLFAMPMKYLGGNDGPVAIIGQIHGFLYMIYVVVAVLLANRCGWSLVKTLLVLLAGTVPFAVFFAERKVVKDERARNDELVASTSG